jgi:hypothetical protein
MLTAGETCIFPFIVPFNQKNLKEAKMKKIVMFAVSLLVFSVLNAYAQCTTTVSGIIDGETWTLEGSPYCVEGDVSVVDLVIEPGVIVEFLGDFAFDVSGTLVATGTADALIQFIKADGVACWQGISIFDQSQNTELVGCTISGYCNGGLKIYNSTPVIRKCYLIGNDGAISGTGLYVTLSADATDHLVVEDSSISNNFKYANGAGIYAELSAGSMILRNCSINNNYSRYESTGNLYGGGIYAIANGGLELENCEISGNRAYGRCASYNCGSSGYGGGIYMSEGNITLKNCRVISNLASASSGSSGTTSAYAYGGGIFASTGSLQCLNSILSNNSVSASGDREYPRGGGIYNSLATVSLTNCTVVSNVAYGLYNGGGVTQITNSIFYSNLEGQIYGTATVDHSDVQGGHAGEGNIDEDPLFKDNCYQLRCDYSPCVDTGNEYPWYNDTSIPPSCGGERNDMGAYGGPDALAWCAYPSSCLIDCGGVPQVGDFDGDGDVDPVDLFIFSGNYGTE